MHAVKSGRRNAIAFVRLASCLSTNSLFLQFKQQTRKLILELGALLLSNWKHVKKRGAAAVLVVKIDVGCVWGEKHRARGEERFGSGMTTWSDKCVQPLLAEPAKAPHGKSRYHSLSRFKLKEGWINIFGHWACPTHEKVCSRVREHLSPGFP